MKLLCNLCNSMLFNALIAIAIIFIFNSFTSLASTLAINSDNPDFYKPTSEELQQGVAFAAPKYWGVHLRRSKSLRVAFIGGSQTANGLHIDSFLESMNLTAKNMGWNVSVFNEGYSGTHPSIRRFKFFELSTSVWPNVISIDPCLNCIYIDPLRCSSSIDNMKYFINRKYEQQGLEPPYYFFLEFFMVSMSMFHDRKYLSSDRIALPLNTSKASTLIDNANSAKKSRGAKYAPYMMDLARFYGIPVLSVTDVLYPSWARFFLTHAENERWPYTADGMHFGVEGCQLIAEHILKPFFLDQMMPRDSDELYKKHLPQFGPYPVDLRMFPHDQYKEVHIFGKYVFFYVFLLYLFRIILVIPVVCYAHM